MNFMADMQKKIWKALLFFCIGLITLLLLVSLSFGLYYRDIIGHFLQKEIQKTIKTKVTFAKNFDLRFWADFPQVTCIFSDVNVMGQGNKEPILSIKEMGFQFGLWDFLHNNYKVRSLSLRDGWLLLKTDENGIPHFDIFIPSKEKTAFSIATIRADNLTITYADLFFDQHFTTQLTMARWDGSLMDKKIEGRIKADMVCQSWRSGTAIMLTGQLLTLHSWRGHHTSAYYFCGL